MTDNDEYTAAYSYAADGIRLRAQESNHEFPDRWFVYDGVRPTAEGTLSGDTFTARERYIWEGNSYYDPLVYLVWDNDRYYPLFDGLGSTRQLTDEDEDVTDTYSYAAFGNSMGSTGSTTNPYKYVGSLGYYQTGSFLQHLGARYYLPEIGRFIQRDPVQADPAAYSYARQSPTSFVDPDGHFAWWWLCAIPCGANVGALAAAALGCIGAPDWNACMHDVLSDPKIKCWYRDVAGAACIACLSAGLIHRRPGRVECVYSHEYADPWEPGMKYCFYTCDGELQPIGPLPAETKCPKRFWSER